MKGSSQSCEMASQTQPTLLLTHQPNKSFLNIKILVVDEDPTCLAIVTALLKRYSSFQGDVMLKFTVTAFKSPLEAVKVLEKEEFDLVLMNLDMHEMGGKNFMQVTRQIQLPTIADDNEHEMVKTLEDGAALYLMKPINKEDLKNLWKYAYTTRTNDVHDHEEDTKSASSVNNIKSTHDDHSAKNTTHNKKIKLGKKRSKEDDDDQEDCHSRKKAKVVWTGSLHNQFLQAVNHFGLEKAYPKRILEFMRVPWLTRENVASHLQKYRLFLKKVSEKGLTSSTTVSSKGMNSNFFDLFSLYKRMKPEDLEMIKRGRRRSPLSGYPYKSSNFGTLRYPNDLPKFQDASAYNNLRTTLLDYCDNYNNPYPNIKHDFSMNNHFNGGNVHSRNSASFNVNVTSTSTRNRSPGYTSSMQLPSFSTNPLPQLSVDHRGINLELPHSSRQVSLFESSSGRINNTPNIDINGDTTVCDNMFNYQEFDNIGTNGILQLDSGIPPSNQINNVETNNIINEFSQPSLSSELFTAAYKDRDTNHEHVNPNNFGGSSNLVNDDQGGKETMEVGSDESSPMKILPTSKDTDWADEFLISLLGDDWETG